VHDPDHWDIEFYYVYVEEEGKWFLVGDWLEPKLWSPDPNKLRPLADVLVESREATEKRREAMESRVST
jgi:hypothetical protein